MILEAVAPEPGMAIADIGAGAGFFTFLLAERIGLGGRVVATDMDPMKIAGIQESRDRLGFRQVDAVLVDAKDPEDIGLTTASVDVILLVNVFPLFEYHEPRDRKGLSHSRRFLRSCAEALRPGGRLVIHRDGLERSDCSANPRGSGVEMSPCDLVEAAAPWFKRQALVSHPAQKESSNARDGYLLTLRKFR